MAVHRIRIAEIWVQLPLGPPKLICLLGFGQFALLNQILILFPIKGTAYFYRCPARNAFHNTVDNRDYNKRQCR